MPDRPALQFPVPTRPDPELLDILFFEEVDMRTYAQQVRLAYGAEHPNTSQYPGFKLVREEVVDQSVVKRWWCNVPVNQDGYNYDLGYGESNVDYPEYTRRYLYRRDQYVAGTAQGSLGGVWLVAVTAGGSDYQSEPTVTASAGNATFRALITPGGAVGWVIVTSEGNGYAAAPTLTFSGGGTGASGAAATCYIQPAGCVLVGEQLKELADDDPRRSLYVMVIRTYMTLPGPVLSTPGWDEEDGGLTIDYTQHVALPASPQTKGSAYGPAGYVVTFSTVQPFRSNRYNANPQGEGTVVGTLIIKTKKLPVPSNVLGTTGYITSYPDLYETAIDPTTAIIVDMVKQVVPAGTLGDIIDHDAKDIALIIVSNPGHITTAIAHKFTTGDVVTIGGVAGNTPSLTGNHQITVIDALNFTLNAINITVAGTGGSVYRSTDPPAYIDITSQHEWGSVQVRSAARASSVKGTSTGISYPMSIQFRQNSVTVDQGFVIEGHDIGYRYLTVPGEEGHFKGLMNVYYMTDAQLADYIADYPNLERLRPGGERTGVATDSFGTGRVWTFRVQASDVPVPGTVGPHGGHIITIQGENMRLGLTRVMESEIFITGNPFNSSSSA